jgi:hypothetical protein
MIKARVPSEDNPDTLRTIDHVSEEEIIRFQNYYL